MNFSFFPLGIGKDLWSEKLDSPSSSPHCILSASSASLPLMVRLAGRTLVMGEEPVIGGGPGDTEGSRKEQRPAGPEGQGLSLRTAAGGASVRELSSLESRFSVCLYEALVSVILVFIINLK